METSRHFIPVMEIEEFKTLIRSIVREVLQEMNDPGLQMLHEFMNARDAAKFLNMAMQTLYEKTSHKVLPHYKYGNKIVFKRSELEHWMTTRKVSTLADLELKAYESSRQGKERRALRNRSAIPRN